MSEEQVATEEKTDNKRPPAKRHITIIDNYRMRLEAPHPKGGERNATLALTFVGDNPRFNLNTQVEEDSRQGYLPVRINIRTLRRIMNLILATASGESPNGNTVKNYHNYDADGNYNEEPVHVSTFIIGKEEDGRIYIGIQSQGYTPIKFHFVTDPYHVICNRKGEPLPIGEVSPLVAKDYADLVNEFLPMALHEVAMAKGVALDAPVKAQEGDDPSVEAGARADNEQGQRQYNNNGGGNRNYGNNNRGGGYNNNRGGGNNYNRGGNNNYRGGGGGGNYNRGGGNNYNRGGNNNYGGGNNRNYGNNNGGNNGGNFKREQSTDFDTTSGGGDGDVLEF